MMLTQIYRDENLYGNALVSLPHKIWSFSNGEFCLYDRPDPGTLVVEKNYFFAKKIHYRMGQKLIFRPDIIGEKQLCNLIEFIGRRILAPCATAASFFTLAPIGFIAKTIHFSVCRVSIYIASIPLAQKINNVWNDTSLFGHALTSAPSKCYRFSTSPLCWHLRADGDDRRAFVAQTNGQGDLETHEAEYQLVPFELFEFIYKRVIGGSLTLVATTASPIGLAAKGVHLASQSAFA